jgi:hypothetical protein
MEVISPAIPSNSLYRGLIIIFARNEKHSALITLKELSQIPRERGYKITFVDDLSNDGSYDYLKSAQRSGAIHNSINIQSKSANWQPGIKGSIEQALVNQDVDFVLPMPGHHMFSVEDVIKVCSESSDKRIVIGRRVNLFTSRPIAKALASKIFAFSFRYFFRFRQVQDPHGLISYPKSLLSDSIRFTSSHENHIIPLLLGRRRGMEFVTLDVKVREEHKRESKVMGRPKAPRLRDIMESLLDLAKAKEILRSIPD